MKPELLKQLKALRGKRVHVEYGVTLADTGVLNSYTTGFRSEIMLVCQKHDIFIPTDQIRSLKEVS